MVRMNQFVGQRHVGRRPQFDNESVIQRGQIPNNDASTGSRKRQRLAPKPFLNREFSIVSQGRARSTCIEFPIR